MPTLASMSPWTSSTGALIAAALLQRRALGRCAARCRRTRRPARALVNASALLLEHGEVGHRRDRDDRLVQSRARSPPTAAPHSRHRTSRRSPAAWDRRCPALTSQRAGGVDVADRRPPVAGSRSRRASRRHSRPSRDNWAGSRHSRARRGTARASRSPIRRARSARRAAARPPAGSCRCLPAGASDRRGSGLRRRAAHADRLDLRRAAVLRAPAATGDQFVRARLVVLSNSNKRPGSVSLPANISSFCPSALASTKSISGRFGSALPAHCRSLRNSGSK